MDSHANLARSLEAPLRGVSPLGILGTGKSTWLAERFVGPPSLNLVKGSDYLPLLKDPSPIRQVVADLLVSSA
jgi:hypothetical protein